MAFAVAEFSSAIKSDTAIANVRFIVGDEGLEEVNWRGLLAMDRDFESPALEVGIPCPFRRSHYFA